MSKPVFGLLLGGALGNAIDRARLGYVVDFLDFHWKGWHWLAFNSADASITMGVIVLIALALVQVRAGKSRLA